MSSSIDRRFMNSIWSSQHTGWSFGQHWVFPSSEAYTHLHQFIQSSGCHLILGWYTRKEPIFDILEVVEGIFSSSIIFTLANGFDLWILGVYGPNSKTREHPFGVISMIYQLSMNQIELLGAIST